MAHLATPQRTQRRLRPGLSADTSIRDGDDYVINGQKIYIGSLHGCEMMWTIVVTDPDRPRHEIWAG